MKKTIILLATLFAFANLKAGEGDNYFSISAGPLHKNAISAELTYEKTLAYHDAYEIGLDYYNQCFNMDQDSTGKKINHYAILFQGAYKKVLVRYKNSNLKIRLAAGIGANEDDFTCSVTPGFEYNYTFANNFQFFIQEKNQFSFWSNNHSWLRVGVLVGIKIPF